MSSTSANKSVVPCPVCDREFPSQSVEEHVNKCIFLNSQSTAKRNSTHFSSKSPIEKRFKCETSKGNNVDKETNQQLPTSVSGSTTSTVKLNGYGEKKDSEKSAKEINIPLAEKMRPSLISDIIGQANAFGPGSMLRSLIEKKKIPNMILWGPPGCGKTSLANVIASICKEQNNLRFVKLSATTAGINDVKEVVKVAKNEAQFKRQTILFMDEIHRFNKLQQDSFLPHVENGTIVLVGATTENPSFSLNNALLSRCRVVVMEKLSVSSVLLILERSLQRNKMAVIVDSEGSLEHGLKLDRDLPRYIVSRESLRWLAEVCDGDARCALSALEMSLSARDPGPDLTRTGPAALMLEDIKDGIKRSHMLYDKGGEEHYNIISAIQKSIRASDDNAALYWTTRALHSGEDPLYIVRRLIRTASEDIGLADPSAVSEAVSCLQGCQHLGMPECGVLVAQCAVRLARAPKSQHLYRAMTRVQRALTDAKGPLPPVPMHLRNAPTKLMKQLGYGRGYNTMSKDESGLTYMPEGMEHVDFFHNLDNEMG